MKRKFATRRGKWKKLKPKWRRPRGIQSKLRRNFKGLGKKPSIGYSSKKKEIFLIRSPKEIKKIEGPVIIASTVGKKKREEMVKRLAELKIEVLNK